MKLVIANTSIHQDTEGRYSLNDLHKAAGCEDRHQPRYFLANQQTQDLITEISASTDGGIPLSVKKGGVNQGSYACKEIVYAYAMWIRPKVHLQVIRTFDALVMGDVEKAKRTAGGTALMTKRSIDAATAFIRNAAQDLRLAQSSVLSMYQKLEDKAGLAGLLPAYAVDAPESSDTGSSEPTKPIGELLDQFGVGMSAVAFNKLLLQHGFLVELERKSSTGTKRYKSITDLEYGKNLTSPANPRETQPHWFVSKFPELLDLVLDRVIN